MKPQIPRQPRRGFTLWDLLICLAALAILALGEPYWSGRHRKPKCGPRVNCINNLKQVGLAMRMWSNDHGDKFPWQVSTNQGGTLELAESAETFRHFLATSNELTSPRILVCVSDTNRTRVPTFEEWNNQHLSYFVGLDAEEGRPQSILSGDRLTGPPITNGIMRITASTPVAWSSFMHNQAGNIAMSDGSSQQATAASFLQQVQIVQLTQTNRSALRLAMP